MEKTDLFPPEIKPIRSGLYLSQIFDGGWTYDWMIWWSNERQLWLEQENGWALSDQNVSWRGLKEQANANG